MLAFLKTTCLGGVVFLVPIVLFIAVIDQALALVASLAAPIAAVFPVSSIGDLAIVHIVALVILLFACFLAGLAAKTAIAGNIVDSLEANILDKIPAYALMKMKAGTMLSVEDAGNMVPVLIQFDECSLPAFQIHGRHRNILRRRHRAFHARAHHRARRRHRVHGILALKQELVVYLRHQPNRHVRGGGRHVSVFRGRRIDPGRGRRGEPATHRDLHQIRGAPLDQRVHRLALGLGAFRLVRGADTGQRPVPSAREHHHSFAPRALLGPRHERPHPGKRAKERVG